MDKKNFKDKAVSKFLSDFSEKKEPETQDVQNAQGVHSAQDVQHTQDVQIRKRKKLPRINMAFQEDNLEYLQIMSNFDGISITKYVNQLIENNKDLRKKEFEEFKSIRNMNEKEN